MISHNHIGVTFKFKSDTWLMSFVLGVSFYVDRVSVFLRKSLGVLRVEGVWSVLISVKFLRKKNVTHLGNVRHPKRLSEVL